MRVPYRLLAAGCCLAAVGALCAACSLSDKEQEIEVVVPSPPAHWQLAFPGLCFEVTAWDAAGEQTLATVAGWGSPAAIRCAKAVNVPVLAFPYVADDLSLEKGALRPAGGFFPRSLRRREGRVLLDLTWEEGAAAWVLDRVARTGRDLSRFNVDRLCGYLQEAGDPWRLDLDTVAQKIAQGTFTAWDIDRLPAWDVTVAPGPGTWFLESPFSLPVAARDASLVLRGLAEGDHLLCSLAGERWALQVGKDGPVLSR